MHRIQGNTFNNNHFGLWIVDSCASPVHDPASRNRIVKNTISDSNIGILIQAQIAGWYTLFTDRLASAYDRDQNISIFRNLGKVDKYGVDVSVVHRDLGRE